MAACIKPVLTLVATTFIPMLELRASRPLGCFTPSIRDALGFTGVVATCFVSNVLFGMAVFEAMALAEGVLLRFGWFERRIWPMLLRRREMLRDKVEKYGIWGVSIFIGIPLPGTGAMAGAMASYLLHLDRKRFWLANLVGVFAAAVAVAAVCMLIEQGAVGEDSLVRRLFLK